MYHILKIMPPSHLLCSSKPSFLRIFDQTETCVNDIFNIYLIKCFWYRCYHTSTNLIKLQILGSERFTRWLEGSEGERRVCGVFNELSRTSRFMLKSREISLKTPQTLRSLLLPFTPFCPLTPCPHKGGEDTKT